MKKCVFIYEKLTDHKIVFGEIMFGFKSAWKRIREIREH